MAPPAASPESLESEGDDRIASRSPSGRHIARQEDDTGQNDGYAREYAGIERTYTIQQSGQQPCNSQAQRKPEGRSGQQTFGAAERGR
jgi:hypothetical protein